MRILFLQHLALEQFGLMYLSAVLKKAGHHCEVLLDPVDRNIVEETKRVKPDVIAFSCMTSEVTWALKTAERIKYEGPANRLFLEDLTRPSTQKSFKIQTSNDLHRGRRVRFSRADNQVGEE